MKPEPSSSSNSNREHCSRVQRTQKMQTEAEEGTCYWWIWAFILGLNKPGPILHSGCDLRATCTNCETEKTVYHVFRGSQIFLSISSSLFSKDLKFQWRPRTESAPTATDRRWSSSEPDAPAPSPTQCASSSLPIRPATCAPRRSPFPPSKTLITGTRAQIRRNAAVLISRESWIVRLKFGGFWFAGAIRRCWSIIAGATASTATCWSMWGRRSGSKCCGGSLAIRFLESILWVLFGTFGFSRVWIIVLYANVCHFERGILHFV